MSAADTVELHSRMDRAFGISREVGKRWMDAAREGNLKAMREIAKTVEENGGTDAVWRLVHYNGQSTSYGFVGAIALHWASANGDVEMSQFLIRKGSSVNCQNNGGSTPLHSACSNGQLSTARLLLMSGANIQISDCCGDTPANVIRPDDPSTRTLHSLLLGACLAERLQQCPPQSWSVRDMKDLIEALNHGATKNVLDKETLVQMCAAALKQMRDVSQEAEQYDARASAFLREVWDRHYKRMSEITEDNEEDGEEVAAEVAATKAQAQTIKEKGNVAFQQGDFPKAIQLYTMAIAVDPTNGLLYSNRSAAYLSYNQPARAMKDAKASVDLMPAWAKGYHRLGRACLALARYEQAEAAFQRGLLLCPGDTALQAGINEARAFREEHVASSHSSSSDEDFAASRQQAEMSKSEEPYVPPDKRAPWFDCPLCENRTRDKQRAPCCGSEMCGTCWKRRRNTCPVCHKSV